MKIAFVVFYQVWTRKSGAEKKVRAVGFSSRGAALEWIKKVPHNLCNINLYPIEWITPRG